MHLHSVPILRGFTPARLMSLSFVLLLAGGCAKASAVAPLPSPQVIGGPGKGDGLFHQPRAITALADGSCVVIDRSGRVQCFDADGGVRTSFSLPEYSNGQPIDCTASPWGTLLVADTHYARVIEFTFEGVELRRIGVGSGLEIVRGIAVGLDETIYVADYGAEDRVHRFDRAGNHLGTLGRRGEGEGEFLRPEGLAIGEGGDLFVIDCGHHRVLRFRPDGTYVSTFGEFGDEDGHFTFPMDITATPDRTLYVVDFQGNRVQRFSADGTCLGVFGGAGYGKGRLATPRGVAVNQTDAGDRIYVADTNNHRVQSFLWPRTGKRARGG